MTDGQWVALVMLVLIGISGAALYWFGHPAHRADVAATREQPAWPAAQTPRLTDTVGKHSVDGATEDLARLRIPCMCVWNVTANVMKLHPACPYHGTLERRR